MRDYIIDYYIVEDANKRTNIYIYVENARNSWRLSQGFPKC